jgi:hypothetical protein
MTFKLIFICHNETIVKNLQRKYVNPCIIFVGNSKINIDDPNVIIARNLMHNIEDQPKLLTFTAWYLIIKNDLFLEYEYICLLEYDVYFKETFEDNLNKICKIGRADVVSFKILNDGTDFLTDINPNVLNKYLISKKINYNAKNQWFPTTNACIKRSILADFVDWYYPSCLEIKKDDYKKLSWYHERLFNVYIQHKKYLIRLLPEVSHIQLNSHNAINA